MSQARVFQCPSCHEFIATDATSCRFCHVPIDATSAQSAADSQEQENRRYRRNRAARHMLTGAGLFLLGLVITVGTYAAASSSSTGGHYLITWGLMLSGLGDLLYGFVGWLGELKN